MGGTISTDMTIMRQINCKEADELSEALLLLKNGMVMVGSE